MKIVLLSLVLSLVACSSSSHPPATGPVAAAKNDDHWKEIVAATDRSAKDRSLDAGRHPVETLRFLDLSPGMAVAEIGAGPGYTTELMTRAVGPSGKVFMQNEPTWMPFLKDSIEERFTHPVMKDVVRVSQSFQDPLPKEAAGLDLVVMNMIYHDVVNTKTDRLEMNRAILRSLKSGGRYVVIDSTAAGGSGLTATETLHRIEEPNVREEVLKAGFAFSSSGDFLRNPADTRDWSASPGDATKLGKRGTSDRFVLAFSKP